MEPRNHDMPSRAAGGSGGPSGAPGDWGPVSGSGGRSGGPGDGVAGGGPSSGSYVRRPAAMGGRPVGPGSGRASDPRYRAVIHEGPVMAGGRSRAARRARLVLGAAMLILVVMVTSAGGLLFYGRQSIERAPITGMARVDRAPVILPGGEEIEIMNVLLIGSDARETLTASELNDGTTGRRPDTLMLAQLELNGTRAALLSFPRDLRVELCDGSLNKINASFMIGERLGMGGESCLVQTITKHTGIEIHHYAEVDFRGFMNVIEVLGGVTMYLDQPMIDSKAHLNVPAGCVTLTPEQALGFVRSRGYDDDFGRIARQQRFIREVVQELSSLGVIANPAKLFSLVNAGANAVTTDEGFSLGVMREVVEGARNLTADDLQTHTVPGDAQMIDGVSYVVERSEEAQAIYARFRDGSVLGESAGAAITGTEAPSEPVTGEVSQADASAQPAVNESPGPQATAPATAAPTDAATAAPSAGPTDVPSAAPTAEPAPSPERSFRGADPGDVDC